MSSNAGKEKFKSKIGGQAVIEGVMMRGIDKGAMANRMPDGTIDLDEWEIKGGKNPAWYRKTPFIRGIFNFVTSMIDGYKCISYHHFNDNWTYYSDVPVHVGALGSYKAG